METHYRILRGCSLGWACASCAGEPYQCAANGRLKYSLTPTAGGGAQMYTKDEAEAEIYRLTHDGHYGTEADCATNCTDECPNFYRTDVCGTL